MYSMLVRWFWLEDRNSKHNLFAFDGFIGLWVSLACVLKIKDGCKQKSARPAPPQKVVLEPPLLLLFFNKVHDPMRNEKLGKVTVLSGPNLNIEWAVLQKSPGGLWSSQHQE